MHARTKKDVVVISDIHLGTFGCQAKSLISYLRSIEPEILILNGDIIDIWQFNKRFFPASHMQVIKEIFGFLSRGVKVYYLTGNHDELLRKYSDLTLGNLTLTDKVLLELNGKKTWIFHGDVFDLSVRGSAKMLARLGGHGYDLLILMNQCINWCLTRLGKEKMSFSKRVKEKVKKAVSWIADFENTASELAIENGYDVVICGHIHQPQKRMVFTAKGNVLYMNSGDWVENCTALEYVNENWEIVRHVEEERPENFKMQNKSTLLPEINEALHVILNPA